MLNRLIAIINKEQRVLFRDRMGLVILYLMPLLLVMIMVFIQDRTFRFLDDVRLEVFFLDLDNDRIGSELEKKLVVLPQIRLLKEWNGTAVTEEILQKQVAAGSVQAGLIVPAGLTQAGRNLLRQGQKKSDDGIPVLQIYFDPVIKPSMREMLNSTLMANLARMETALLFETIREEMKIFGIQADKLLNIPDSEVLQEGLLKIDARVLDRTEGVIVPNAVQHNIPGWTLFAMFFIVIPLAGGIIQERNEGTLRRLLSTPVNYVELLTAKILVYLMVCLSQFALMLALGKYILPLTGLPELQLGAHFLAILLVALASALAATGFGVMVGSFASTHQQASSFGAVSVIIAAALGGIWVPVFIMPEFMQQLSNYSPMAWGLKAFHQLFLRDGNINTVQNEIVLLLLFFLFTLSTAVAKFRLNKN